MKQQISRLLAVAFVLNSSIDATPTTVPASLAQAKNTYNNPAIVIIAPSEAPCDQS